MVGVRDGGGVVARKPAGGTCAAAGVAPAAAKERGADPRRRSSVKVGAVFVAIGLGALHLLSTGMGGALQFSQEGAASAWEQGSQQHVVASPAKQLPAQGGSVGLDGTRDKDVVLVLASHRKLVLYNVDRDAYHTVDQNNGIYYGVFPGEQPYLLWVGRSLSVGRKPDEISLFNVQRAGNAAMRKSTLVQTSYMHDAVVNRDKSHAFVVDVTGVVLMLNYPSMALFKQFPVFTKGEHINTLAVTNHGTLLVMLHNRGASSIVELDPFTGERICEIQGVGNQAHGLVLLEDGQSVLILSSKDVALVRVALPRNCLATGKLTAEREVLWQYSTAGANEPRKFLKGLAVVDGVAYFGISDFQGNRAGRSMVDTSLVAVDIDKRQHLWTRAGVGTKGIINVVAAPHFSPSSTYQSITREQVVNAPVDLARIVEGWVPRGSADPLGDQPGRTVEAAYPAMTNREETFSKPGQRKDGPNKKGLNPARKNGADDDDGADADDADAGVRVAVGPGEADSCTEEFMQAALTSKVQGIAHGIGRSEDDAFYRLPLKFDVEQLQREARAMEDKFGYTYRKDVNNYFILLVTKDGELEEGRQGPFSPVPDRLGSPEAAYLRRVVDSLGITVGRSRFMMLKAGEMVKPHRDDVQFLKRPSKTDPEYSNGYWGRRFRIHIPIVTDPLVKFNSGGTSIHMEAGYAYLFDNGNVHSVENKSPHDRVHLIIDTIGSVRLFELASQGVAFKVSGEATPKPRDRLVPHDPVADALVQPVFEEWVDPKAFSYMPTADVVAAVERLVLARLPASSAKAALTSSLEHFAAGWQQSCGDAVTPQHEECNELAENLVRASLKSFGCRTTLDNSSVRVADVMEAISRMLFFACKKGPGRDSEAAAEVAAEMPFLPIPGHPFRVPLCRRTKRRDAVAPIQGGLSAEEPGVNGGTSKPGNSPDLAADKVCANTFFRELAESKTLGFPFGVLNNDMRFLRLPLKFDVDALRADAKRLEETFGYTFRADVNNYFILLATKEGELEQGRVGPFAEVPGRYAIAPYLRRVVDELGLVLGRSRFMMLKAGEKVKKHVDDVQFVPKRQRVGKGLFLPGYWGRRFRMHIPIVTHPEVIFGSSEARIHMEAGYAYLFDNGNNHYVENNSPVDRVHLIIDTIGTPRLFELMKRGEAIHADGSITEGDAPTAVPPNPEKDEKIRLITEDWVDPAAFDAMPTDIFRGYVERNILARMPVGRERNALADRLDTFCAAWDQDCAEVDEPNLRRCNSHLVALLRPTVEENNCSGAPTRLTDSSVTVVDALEAIIRSAYFACSSPLVEDAQEAAALPRPEDLLLPLPGHNFLLPACQRGKKTQE